MKKLFFILCTLCLLPMAAAAQSISTLCNNGPTLTQYQLPLGQNGAIEFAAVNVLDTERFDQLPIAANGDPDHVRWADPLEIDITPIGAPDCLSAESASVYRLLTSYGAIDLASEDMVKITIFNMERAAFDEGSRVEDAYLDRSSS